MTNKDITVSALKLVKDTERTKVEVLLHGPINLHIQQMQEQLNEIVETNETSRKSFFVLPSLQRPNDDMR